MISASNNWLDAMILPMLERFEEFFPDNNLVVNILPTTYSLDTSYSGCFGLTDH
jgi:hypothetical protein